MILSKNDYHVFITPYGDTKGLYVACREATRFEVREQQGGNSDATFSYRIIAKRKDVPQKRMPQTTIHQALLDLGKQLREKHEKPMHSEPPEEGGV